jgi:hypothetical protein
VCFLLGDSGMGTPGRGDGLLCTQLTPTSMGAPVSWGLLREAGSDLSSGGGSVEVSALLNEVKCHFFTRMLSSAAQAASTSGRSFLPFHRQVGFLPRR